MISAGELRELIAAECHSQWCGWMRYLFSKCEFKVDPATLEGCAVIPQASVVRWRRQQETPYSELPEHEKESDRVEADKIIALLSRSWGP